MPAAPAAVPPAAPPAEAAARRGARADLEVLGLALAVLALALVLQVTPARDGVTLLGARLPEVCTARRLVDAGCPGCGLTRSVVLAARLDLGGALALNPVGPAFLLLLAAQVPWRAWRLARGGSRAAGGRVPWGSVHAGLALALVAVWLLRLALGAPPA